MHLRRTVPILLAMALLLPGCDGQEQDKPAKPVLRLFCGGSMRRPIEVLIREFEAEHDCRVETVFNGCGVLVGQMQLGATGDIYYACDTSFMAQARGIGAMDESYPIANLTRFHPVIMVQKGNPLGIESVEDLAKEKVKSIGLGNEDKGAVGRTGWGILRASPKWDQIRPKIKAESPTADGIAVQLTLGNLSAAVIWDVVAKPYVDRGKADIVPIAGRVADQPIGLMKKAKQPELAREFIQFVRSDHARQVFRDYGFIIDEPTTRPE